MCDALVEAGLSLSEVVDCIDEPGARVEVDDGRDPGGGVYLSWKAGRALRETARASVMNHQFEDASIRRTGEISRIMADAMAELLRTQDYDVVWADPPDDLRPYTLRILALPGGERLARFGPTV